MEMPFKNAVLSRNDLPFDFLVPGEHIPIVSSTGARAASFVVNGDRTESTSNIRLLLVHWNGRRVFRHHTLLCF